ncbi:MAG TPA: hypothetical protein VHB21_21235 [Minicystis sp.]|nr:hypothetical protein [Minicystis sp.]
MRIALRKLTDERHALELTHDDGREERAACETRSYLVHDLVHYALEAEAGLAHGFWGMLASYGSLERLRHVEDRIAESINPIERVVGALQGALKADGTDAEIVAALRRYGESIGAPRPAWVDEDVGRRSRARLRALLGAWRATARGDALHLAWPPRLETCPS